MGAGLIHTVCMFMVISDNFPPKITKSIYLGDMQAKGQVHLGKHPPLLNVNIYFF